MEELLLENDMKDVVCAVYLSLEQRDNASIYLIDLAREKLRAYVHLDSLGFPWGMACVVLKSKLYMFGGHDFSENSAMDMIGCSHAYVLDFLKLANSPTGCGSNNKLKPLPKRICDMKAGKGNRHAVLLHDGRICVFDFVLGHKPPDTSFEIFDPANNTWDTVPDPFYLSPGHFVDRYCVKDNMLYVCIREETGVYELSIRANASPTWIHHPSFLGVELLPIRGGGFQMGSLMFRNHGVAYDLAKDGGFVGCEIPVHWLGDTADKDYEVCHEKTFCKLKLGDDRICTIQPKLLCKPGPVADGKYRIGSLGLQPVLRKCHNEGSYSFIVSIYSFNRSDECICMNLLQSFKVPMHYSDKRIERRSCMSGASLCEQ